MNFSDQELADMIYVIGESGGNCLLASRIYKQSYPQRRQPNVKAFRRAQERFSETLSASYKKHTMTRYVLNENLQENVVLSVVEHPGLGQRKLGEILEVSQTTIHRALKLHNIHGYHYQKVQHLRAEDFPRRMLYCQWALNKITDDRRFFSKVLFTDESYFSNNVLPNMHNLHHYSDTNPHLTRPRNFQRRWVLNVWGGILGENIIGPHFFDEPLDGERYSEFLRNELPLLLEDVPLNLRYNMWLQHDGAPPHYFVGARNFLDHHYVDRWIGRGGPVEWPARSPDLTPCDYFLWGYIKNMVYTTPPTTAQDMRQRIRAAFQQVQHERMLFNLQEHYSRRLEICLEKNGQNFEQFL